MIRDYFSLLRSSPRVLGFGFLLAFFSSFGQTFYISLSVPQFMERFELSNTQWGSLYSGATLLSALCLPFAGSLMDRMPIQTYARNVALGLAAACAITAGAPNLGVLALGLFGLRFTGQGLLSITATATMARTFNKQRGKALSIATMGFPLGETFFPPLTIALIAHLGWRPSWWIAAFLAIACLAPVAYYLPQKSAAPSEDKSESQSSLTRDRTHWDRGQVLSYGPFYLLLPTYIAPGFLATGLILYQFTLADQKGWSHAIMAGSFVSFGLSRLAFAFLIGPLIDRFGASRLFSIQLAPLALGMLIMARFDHISAAFLYNGLMGVSLGIGSSTTSALWAELFGTRHLGAIKSLMSTIGIFCTALSPILVGTLLDRQLPFEQQLMIYSACLVVFAIASLSGIRLHHQQQSRE